MVKQHTCSICSKELANRHNLSRHKKYNCNGLKMKENVTKHDRIVYSTGKGINVNIIVKFATPSAMSIISAPSKERLSKKNFDIQHEKENKNPTRHSSAKTHIARS